MISKNVPAPRPQPQFAPAIFLTIYRRNQPIKLMIISHNLSSDIQIFRFQNRPNKITDKFYSFHNSRIIIQCVFSVFEVLWKMDRLTFLNNSENRFLVPKMRGHCNYTWMFLVKILGTSTDPTDSVIMAYALWAHSIIITFNNHTNYCWASTL